MTSRMRAILASTVLVASLSSCHQQKAGHGEVSGQILPGSISDAMLPYDAVKSKAPLAPRQSAGTGDDAASDGAATAAVPISAVPDAAASPAPAAPAVIY